MKPINPYSYSGEKHVELLDTIATNLPADPTFEQLNEILVAGLFPPAPPGSPLESLAGISNLFLVSVLPNAYNAYVQPPNPLKGVMGGYNEKQQEIIAQIFRGIQTGAPEDLETYLTGVEENILRCGLSFAEQTPLFVAVAVCKSDAQYWLTQLDNPGTSLWAAYLLPDKAMNYIHIPAVIFAAVQGSLSAYSIISHPKVDITDIFTSILASSGMAAGKVVFGWVGG